MHFMNTYNTAYMFYAMVMGFWFAMVYIFTKKRELKPLTVTFIAHLAVNLVAFLAHMSDQSGVE